MIVQEPYENNLIRTVSDKGKYIIQNETGAKYAEAIDVPNRYTYTETDEDIEEMEEEEKQGIEVPINNTESLVGD